MRTKTVAVILLGIFVWIMAAVIGLLMNADAKFFWTCVVGISLGIIGIPYSIRRDRRSGL
jgi:uncharacterized oligopeptide transporter (OPT) family protein